MEAPQPLGKDSIDYKHLKSMDGVEVEKRIKRT